jgi:hypothetical protein
MDIVKLVLLLGIPLHRLEEYLDWLDNRTF